MKTRFWMIGLALLSGAAAGPIHGPALALQAQPAPDAAAAGEAEAPPPVPQFGDAVAAIVNDHPISTFDVQQRIRLMLASSGAQLPPEALAQMQEQALRDLIEERLKLQEAARFELEIPDGQIEEELARIAASGGGSPDALAADLASQGIAIETLREKIRADAAWEQLVRGRYGNRVTVSQSEVDDILTDLRAATQQEQYLLSEICLPLDDPRQAEQMRGVGMQMIQQMQQGVPFRALAQQFSACPSAARGGDLGWVTKEEMSPAISQLVDNLAPGNVSLPVPDEGKLVMIAIRQKRDAAQAGEPSFMVAYAGAPKSVGEERAKEAFSRLREANACGGGALSVDLGPDIGVMGLPMLPAQSFAPEFRPVLATLERGDVSGLLETETAYHAFMLCQKDEGLGLPSRMQVEEKLRTDAFDRLSRRYLRDVERDSAVQMRLSADG